MIGRFDSPGDTVKRLLLAAALSAHLALVSSAAMAGPVDDRFQAIYSKEWQWRQEQTGSADEDNDGSSDRHDLPSVDAASQKARLKVWDDVLKQLGRSTSRSSTRRTR